MDVDVLIYFVIYRLDYFLFCFVFHRAECVLFKDTFGFFLFTQRNDFNCRGPPIFRSLNFKTFKDWRIKMNKHLTRNKDKYNPYTLEVDEENNIYTVIFKDSRNVLQKIEVERSVYEAFDKFELEDISQIHKFRKHIEHSEIYEETLFHKTVITDVSMEERLEQKELYSALKESLNCLTKTQKRRIVLHFFEDKSFTEIARIENCDESSIRESIYTGIKKIRKNLK